MMLRIDDIQHNGYDLTLSREGPAHIHALAFAMQRGEVQPIRVTRLPHGHKRPYMIQDGNHRIAAARLLGREFIDARVVGEDE